MDNPTLRDLFLHSLGRCAGSKKYMPAFYDRFLSTSEEVREKFRHTNFEHQHHMMLQSLKLAAHAAAGQHEALHQLTDRAVSHDRAHLHIEPYLYDHWRSALIETSRLFDNQWNEDIEKAWYIVLGHVINHMIRHY